MVLGDDLKSRLGLVTVRALKLSLGAIVPKMRNQILFFEFLRNFAVERTGVDLKVVTIIFQVAHILVIRTRLFLLLLQSSFFSAGIS